jgi:PEP-CTERM motif
MWQFTMAGGAAGWFGFRAGSNITASGPYPNPEQLRTHSQFWENRLLTDMERHNELATDRLAWALATPDFDHIVIYAQNSKQIKLDLAGIDGPLVAVAVDAKGAYLEIPAGQLDATTTHWDAPYASDWALAISRPVPEPAAAGLMSMGLALVAVRFRWR